jgi:DNA repair exonuclease SbcCD nuclease subunit
MSQLFDRAAVFTDIHFGDKNDSERHNIDCLNFVKWFCVQVRENHCDAVIFMGDWFDNRTRIRVDTLDYSWQAIELLNNIGVPVYWLVGNHDLFYRNNRNITSLPYLGSMENIFVINELVEINDVLLAPWLTGGEFAEVPNYDVKYIFGHFELPLFLMNESVTMPDKGGLHADHFTNCDAVFSGHFHKRQLKVNEHGIPVWYPGNAFPHNFNDVNDRDRGCMLLEWGHDPEFVDWPDAPFYSRINLSDLLDQSDSLEASNGIIEVKDDMGIEIEEATEIKELLGDKFREIRLRPANPDLDITIETEIGDDSKSVDEMIIEHLRLLDTEGSDFDAELMVKLYEGAKID